MEDEHWDWESRLSVPMSALADLWTCQAREFSRANDLFSAYNCCMVALRRNKHDATALYYRAMTRAMSADLVQKVALKKIALTDLSLALDACQLSALNRGILSDINTLRVAITTVISDQGTDDQWTSELRLSDAGVPCISERYDSVAPPRYGALPDFDEFIGGN